MEEPGQPLRILLIDDDASIHEAVRALFRAPIKYPEVAVEILSAYTFDEAMEMARSLSPKAILLDLCLENGVSGAVESTLEKVPELARHYPLIVMTGYDSDDVWGRSIRSGAMNFFPKPVYLDPKARCFLLHGIMNAILLHPVMYHT